ncbi:ATPase domain-containing protein [Roseomonas sp. E05]|uniref:ATPase domain-containing protein n=1 Tax=Roseomonas sp. E05 TaxID=3046310 RepID=UPI0024B90056|nr:ATPase domain-containing protein [Roseomonas sp. E05]MDJ0387065.1 ATPase domain-containing protein [Roseomonas sp. E05]
MPRSLRRLTSGVEGLDSILGGGLVEGSTYIVQGHPGSGKTILANQVAFHRAAGGDSALYVTLLAESHERLFQFLSTMDFYDPAQVGSRLNYVSAFQTMQEEGLDGVVRLLRREIPRQKASLLILDGLLNAREKAATTLDVKTFIAALQGHVAFASCTALLLTSSNFDDGSGEYTMVDGVLELREEAFGARAVRCLRVRKSRGSAALTGTHQCEITSRGMVTYPRLEALLAQPSVPDQPSEARTTSGVETLDRLLGGGLPVGSITLLTGPSGTGKTSYGLQFLAQSPPDEPALHFGFYETPARLERKAQALGMDLSPLLNAGRLHILWQAPTANLLDGLGQRLLETVRRHGVKRLFLDSFAGFTRAAVDPNRLTEFFTALINELRARGVTVLATCEPYSLHGPQVTLSPPEIGSMVDNLLLVRFAERNAQFLRQLLIIKVRDSAFDPLPREFIITRQGIQLAEAPSGAVKALAGMAVSGDLPL